VARVRLYLKADYRRALATKVGSDPGHEAEWRSPFWRDRARLIHSPAFRRLQGKTQLFAGLESDFFRNRLTHSIEVAQIARTIGLRLNASLHDDLQLDGDLIEFAALAHDLGHPPFGHTGETVLDQEMRAFGGFEGNAQTLRVLCRLEKKLDDYDAQIDEQGHPIWYRPGEDAAVGLNLCSRTLASILKYDYAIPFSRKAEDRLRKGYYLSEEPVVERIKRDIRVDPAAGLPVVECQIMDIADDIAYSTYDLEDAFKGGLLLPMDVLYPEDSLVVEAALRVSGELHQNISAGDVRDVLKSLFGVFSISSEPPGDDWQDWYFRGVGQAFTSARRFASIGFYRTVLTSALVNSFINAVDLEVDRRHPTFSRVRMHPEEHAKVSVIKHITYLLLTNTPRLRLVAHRGETVVRSIFRALSASDGAALLPPDYSERYGQASELQRPRVICDFIAGMTDRYAVEFYARLSSDVFTTMFKPL
jgi:dGTPase